MIAKTNDFSLLFSYFGPAQLLSTSLPHNPNNSFRKQETLHQGHHQGLNMADQSNVLVFIGEDSSSKVVQRRVPQSLLQYMRLFFREG